MSEKNLDGVCHLIARLADVVEQAIREGSGDELALRKLDNIRHDTLKMLVRPSR